MGETFGERWEREHERRLNVLRDVLGPRGYDLKPEDVRTPEIDRHVREVEAWEALREKWQGQDDR